LDTIDLKNRVSEAGIVPILMATDTDPETAVRIADTLAEAGATVIEILFRSSRAPEALATIKRRHPAILVAAGTVLDSNGAAKAEASGADFLVSPGLSPALHAAAAASALPLVPGVNTASEVQYARELGYTVQKFYPAWDHGHQRLDEFEAIYSDISFLVTGGLTADTVAEFAVHRNIAALGGIWMVESEVEAATLARDRAAFRSARSPENRDAG